MLVAKFFLADNYADYLIVTKAIYSTHKSPTVFLADDTDLLVLLLYHFDPETQISPSFLNKEDQKIGYRVYPKRRRNLTQQS